MTVPCGARRAGAVLLRSSAAAASQEPRANSNVSNPALRTSSSTWPRGRRRGKQADTRWDHRSNRDSALWCAGAVLLRSSAPAASQEPRAKSQFKCFKSCAQNIFGYLATRPSPPAAGLAGPARCVEDAASYLGAPVSVHVSVQPRPLMTPMMRAHTPTYHKKPRPPLHGQAGLAATGDPAATTGKPPRP